MVKILVIVFATPFSLTVQAFGAEKAHRLQGVHYKNLEIVVGDSINSRGRWDEIKARKHVIDFCKNKSPNIEMNAFYIESKDIKGKEKKQIVVTDIVCSEKRAWTRISLLSPIRSLLKQSNLHRFFILRDRQHSGKKLNPKVLDFVLKNKNVKITGIGVEDLSNSKNAFEETNDSDKIH